MKLFLTGASGLLGNAIVSAFLDAGWTVHASAHIQTPTDSRLRLHKIDLTQPTELIRLLKRIHPTAIINAAAYTIPAKCAKLPNKSESLNVQLPTVLADVAVKTGARFIHFSTDMVFDGKRGNYTPDCAANPTNLYGEHKLASEFRVQETYPESCIIRLPLLMGNSPSGTRSVHEALWQAWSQNQTTPLFEDEWRNPVSVCNVAELTRELVFSPQIRGLFHWAGATNINRWEMGNRIADKLGVPKDLLQRTLAINFPQFKDRPLNLTMDSTKLKALVQTEPAPFENQLAEIVRPTG